MLDRIELQLILGICETITEPPEAGTVKLETTSEVLALTTVRVVFTYGAGTVTLADPVELVFVLTRTFKARALNVPE